jgi:hypothetical protein
MQMQGKMAQVKHRMYAACRMWLALCALALACGSPAQAQSATGDEAAAQHAAAMAFLSQLAEQTGDTDRLLLGLWLAGGGISWLAPAKSDQALLDLHQALLASNIHGSPFGPPVPTGDALYDKLALAVDRQMSGARWFETGGYPLQPVVPDAVLAEWEPEFGADPRYWELRYFCAACMYLDAPELAGFNTPSEFLVEAVRRGIATQNTILMLAVAGDAESCIAALPLLGLTPARLPGTDGSMPSDPEAARMRSEEQAQLALHNVAIAMDPQQAWAYYARADYWYGLGEQELGLADLKAGNAAPVYAYIAPWPESVVLQAPLAANPPGSAAVCGAIWQATLFCRINLHVDSSIRQRAVEQKAAANLGGDTESFDAWHQFACRIGTYAGLDPLQTKAAQDTVNIISNSIVETCGDGLEPEQVITCGKMRGAWDCFSQLRMESVLADQQAADCMQILTGMDLLRGQQINQYLALCRTTKASEIKAAVFADLSQIHYPQLNLPECMLKYPALTADEYAAKKEERRFRLEQELERTPQDSGSLTK